MTNLEEVDPEDEPRTYRQRHAPASGSSSILAGVTVQHPASRSLLFFVAIAGQGRGRRRTEHDASHVVPTSAAGARPGSRRATRSSRSTARRVDGVGRARRPRSSRTRRRRRRRSPSCATASRSSSTATPEDQRRPGLPRRRARRSRPQTSASLAAVPEAFDRWATSPSARATGSRRSFSPSGVERVQPELHATAPKAGIATESSGRRSARSASSTQGSAHRRRQRAGRCCWLLGAISLVLALVQPAARCCRSTAATPRSSSTRGSRRRSQRRTVRVDYRKLMPVDGASVVAGSRLVAVPRHRIVGLVDRRVRVDVAMLVQSPATSPRRPVAAAAHRHIRSGLNRAGRSGAMRRKTRQVHVGTVPVGGDAPVSVQSMTTTKTADVDGTLAQIYALAARRLRHRALHVQRGGGGRGARADRAALAGADRRRHPLPVQARARGDGSRRAGAAAQPRQHPQARAHQGGRERGAATAGCRSASA